MAKDKHTLSTVLHNGQGTGPHSQIIQDLFKVIFGKLGNEIGSSGDDVELDVIADFIITAAQVGIGMTPTEKLEVNGNIKADNFIGGLENTNLASFWVIDNIAIDDSWETLTIPEAIANSWILMVSCNATNNSSFGVRPFGYAGAATDFRCTQVSKSALTQMVYIDDSKRIEVYSSNTANTDFIFTTQF